MTAADEDILTSRSLLRSGKAIDAVLQNCIVDKRINAEQLISGDKNALVTFLRVSGYGPEYSVEISCPSCGEESKYDFDLSQLEMKTLDIEEQGINIIRVRQKPLKRIFEDDVMAEKKFDGKQITNDILKQIMKDYDLDKRTLTKIDNYIAKEGLQNQKGLDKYIDQILTEKAERKKHQ